MLAGKRAIRAVDGVIRACSEVFISKQGFLLNSSIKFTQLDKPLEYGLSRIKEIEGFFIAEINGR